MQKGPPALPMLSATVLYSRHPHSFRLTIFVLPDKPRGNALACVEQRLRAGQGQQQEL